MFNLNCRTSWKKRLRYAIRGMNSVIGRILQSLYPGFCNIVVMATPLIRNIRTLMIHLAFWTGVWFLFFYFFSYNTEDLEYITWFSSLLVPLTMAVTYFAVYFLIPNYLLKKRYGRFFLFSFYVLVASSYFIVLIIYGSLIFIKKWDASNIPPMMKNFFFILILVYLVAGLVGFVKILNHNFSTDRKNRELQNKILTTQLELREQELNYLKRQIHPHFLFNTLNTIYGFALKQSKQTPEIILKLSNLLDYILYQVNKPLVSLENEIRHIQEYIELEKIRFSENLRVSFKRSEIDEKIMVPPMLFIPFIENAFKHGSIIDGFLTIEIEIHIDGNNLEFSVSNTVDDPAGNSGGVGMKNIQKRLDLTFKNQYAMEYGRTGDRYSVKLVIHNLTNNSNG